MKAVACTRLGQAGFRLQYADFTLYVDPYLSDSVAAAEGPHQRRLFPVWRSPELVTDAHVVLITHAHMDHCDIDTLVPISRASPMCRFIGPNEVCGILEENGIPRDRLTVADCEHWLDLGAGIRVLAAPAAHPTVERDAHGRLRSLGFLIDFEGRRFYHSGDTFVVASLVEFLARLRPIDVMLLPVNEHNYARERMGIIGNMGIRDAFWLAQHLGARVLVPMHWDMFEANQVYREEIQIVYRQLQLPFEMILDPDVL